MKTWSSDAPLYDGGDDTLSEDSNDETRSVIVFQERKKKRKIQERDRP